MSTHSVLVYVYGDLYCIANAFIICTVYGLLALTMIIDARGRRPGVAGGRPNLVFSPRDDKYNIV